MKSLGCVRAGLLIERRASGLSEAQHLVLERHLSSCRTCCGQARLLDRFRALADTSAMADAKASRLALARALAASDAQQPAPRRTVASRVGIAAALVATAAAAVIVWAVSREPTSSVQSTPTQPREAVLDGEVMINGKRLIAGDVVPSDTQLDAPSGASIALGRARIEVARGGTLAWDADANTVSLAAGSVLVDVASDPTSPPFRVATARFTVEVVGTRFEIDASSVAVIEGTVRVLDPGGSVVVAALRADARWQVPQDPPTAIDSPAGATVSPPDAGIRAPAKAVPSAEFHLRRARKRLAGGDAAGARRAAGRALRADPTTAQEAEGRTLLAECAIAVGDRQAAIALYREIARRFATRTAGENALFAAARLEEESGRRAAARALYREYVNRYPRGRFHRESQARLTQLDR